MKATLILANGSIFSGTSIGSTETRVCEMVFNTSMAGYQVILTDPSYAGQGVVMSYPLIGNYGVNSEDNESRKPWVEAFVVRHLSPRGSNFRCEGDLGSYRKEHNITGIQGVDTRALTKILRSEGSMNGMLTCAEHFNIAQVLEELNAPSPAQQTADGYAQFFALARSYTHLDELDRDTLVTFVDRIEIGPKIYENGGHKVPARANQPYRQSVRIFYKFIGELAEGGEKNSAEKPA